MFVKDHIRQLCSGAEESGLAIHDSDRQLRRFELQYGQDARYAVDKKVFEKECYPAFEKLWIDRMTAEAKEGFFADPLEQQSFYLGSAGMLTIEFA